MEHLQDPAGSPPMPEYSYEWATDLNGITREEWNSCFEAGDVTNCYDLAQAIHHSKLPNMEFYYLLGRRSGSILFAIPCFLYTAPLDVLAPSWIRRIVSVIRKVFRSFLITKAFIVGSPLAICGGSLGLERLGNSEKNIALTSLKTLLIKKGRELYAQLVIIKEIKKNDLTTQQRALSPEFAIVPSMPASLLRLDRLPKSSYYHSLRNGYRSNLSIRRKKFREAKGELIFVSDFASYADRLGELYSQVLSRSKTKFEILTPDFFREVSKRLSDQSELLLIKQNQTILAFCLILSGDKIIHPIYLGMDYAAREELSLYYNLLYSAIEEAERKGMAIVSLGQTAYQSKAYLGAQFAELFLAVCPLTMKIRMIFTLFQRTLFPSVITPVAKVFNDTKVKNVS